MKAFWFSPNDKKLANGDGRAVEVGSIHKVPAKDLKLCENGLHASKRLINALKYAPGYILYLVELSGLVLSGSNKVCASERKYLKSFNAEKLLRHFARKQALINIEKIKPYTSGVSYDLILVWLNTGDESARSAARSAAVSAAWSAAGSAAVLAAWSAKSAAESAAVSAANLMLVEMVENETGWDLSWAKENL